MNARRTGASRGVVFVARELAGEARRNALAVTQLDAVRLHVVCERGPDPRDTGPFESLVRVDDVHDPGRLIAAARGFAEEGSALEQIVTVQETLLGPVAEANEALGLHGLSVAAVRRALDKSAFKNVLERAGVGTARGGLVTCAGDARRWAAEVGFPLVLKPLNGSGGLATWRVRDDEHLALAVDLLKPTPENPVLAEGFVGGRELCLDTITIAGVPRLHSVCEYRPSILEALEDPTTQWTCVLPRDNGGDRYREFVRQGLSAVRGLAVGNAVTHMEGFLPDEGGPRFTDATLRPAGARIGPMLGFAYDIDPYRAWARAVVDGCFDGPWERKYAVGSIFLRGPGRGLVGHVEGFDEVSRHLGNLLVESRPPRVGAPKSATYTGDGYMTVRHPETRVVEDALRRIAGRVAVTYSEPGEPDGPSGFRRERWAESLGDFDQQLTRPAWDHPAPPGADGERPGVASRPAGTLRGDETR